MTMMTLDLAKRVAHRVKGYDFPLTWGLDQSVQNFSPLARGQLPFFPIRYIDAKRDKKQRELEQVLSKKYLARYTGNVRLWNLHYCTILKVLLKEGNIVQYQCVLKYISMSFRSVDIWANIKEQRYSSSKCVWFKVIYLLLRARRPQRCKTELFLLAVRKEH